MRNEPSLSLAQPAQRMAIGNVRQEQRAFYMKRLLLSVLICTGAASCGATEPAGPPDYVGTVLQKLDHSAGTSVSGLSAPRQPEEWFGGYVFKPASRDFAVIQEQ